MDWNEKIKQARKKAGFTQAQLADYVGVHRSTIANYELKRRKPTFIELKKIADVLHVDVNYLVEGAEVASEDELMIRANDVFGNLNISDSDKDLIFQDIMELYLKGKRNNDKSKKHNSAKGYKE